MNETNNNGNFILKKKAFSPIVLIIIGIIAIVITAIVTYYITINNSTNTSKIAKTNDELYNEAVNDSITIEDGEIHELVSINKDSNMVTFDEAKEKVLMLCFNNYPESYIPGNSFTCKYGEVWTFTDKEIISWFKKIIMV